MNVREAMTFPGLGLYYTHRGFSQAGAENKPAGLLHSPPGFQTLPNPNIQILAGSTHSGESSQPNLSCRVNAVETVKRKRGRPRKYGLDGATSLGLVPLSNTASMGLMVAPTPKRARGRPRGSGRKQRLANLGQWMTESAGLAFAPHIINFGIGEDVVAKILLFSQQRQRAVCILSGNGTVSSVTLCQHASCGNLTFEGRFEILCLSGSYLLSKSGGPCSRIGGINVSLSSSSGPVIGGSVSMLIAESPVQVVVCSFVYGNSQTRDKTTADLKGIENSLYQPDDEAATSSAPNQQLVQSSAISIWSDLRNSHTDIDLTR